MFSNISHDLCNVRPSRSPAETRSNLLLGVCDAELLDLKRVNQVSRGQGCNERTLVNSWTRKIPHTSLPCFVTVSTEVNRRAGDVDLQRQPPYGSKSSNQHT